jgi:hypothetical protein
LDPAKEAAPSALCPREQRAAAAPRRVVVSFMMYLETEETQEE